MGASGSKSARTAAGAAARKYPTRPSDATTTPRATTTVPQSQPTRQGPTVNPPPTFSETRDEAINLDASDPVYASHLRTLGAVQPNPMLSNSSIAPEDGATASRFQRPQSSQSPQFSPQAPPANFFPDPRRNPAVTLLNRRQQLQQEAEREAEDLGRPSFAGRQFLDVSTIRQVLMLRDEKRVASEEIEKMLRLRKGVVARLGPKGVVEGV